MMILNDKIIKDIVKGFDIGKLKTVVTTLDSGFQSDNYHIRTTRGDYVFRFFHDSAKKVEYIMDIYDYLASHGIKTPKPVQTMKGTFGLSYNNKVIAVQSFLPGTYFCEQTSMDTIDSLLPFYGKELGKIHQISLQMVNEKGEKKFSEPQDVVSYVIETSTDYLPNNEYIRQQYKVWEQEIKHLPKNQLTKGVIHGDVGPKDFFFKDGEYMGIIDFNAAHLDYLLLDIAPMMMYCALYKPERKNQYINFITAYLEDAPTQKEELRWLHLLLRTRWLLQILYHQYRYMEGITQGLETGKVEENLEGVVDGEYFLKMTNEFSNDYFFKILGD